MKTKIKIFCGGELKVERQVNDFLNSIPSCHVEDIKFQANEDITNVMIRYTEEEK